MKRFSWLLVIAVVAISCQEQGISPFEDFESSLVPNKYSITSQKVLANGRTETDNCGEVSSFTLWAGQHIDAGSVYVYNNEGSLFVTYETSGDWTISETHLYLGSTPPMTRKGSLVIGKFPYKGDHDNAASVTYEIDIEGLDECFDIYAHAVVDKSDDNGNITSETAFGGDKEGDVSRWYFYGSYCIEECEEECVPSDEAGWSAGSLYSDQGSLATYTVYFDPNLGYGVEKYEVLKVGNVEAGIVMFSNPWYNPTTSVGEVTISISLYDCWEFRDIEENVKIQGYFTAPNEEPVVADFVYKYNADNGFIEVTVRENAYFGVHVDLTGGCCD